MYKNSVICNDPNLYNNLPNEIKLLGPHLPRLLLLKFSRTAVLKELHLGGGREASMAMTQPQVT
ncbi:hypothetical protein E2C01_078841 [Portunus trituberculatus]|uniref:Uncharacterized protein n=1 Tax=Portunus trituberculatus TaxID=210409 RepID=A0A5B7IV77_PORTR|nr:hypothetical protein [Portunus trituberculatus]